MTIMSISNPQNSIEIATQSSANYVVSSPPVKPNADTIEISKKEEIKTIPQQIEVEKKQPPQWMVVTGHALSNAGFTTLLTLAYNAVNTLVFKNIGINWNNCGITDIIKFSMYGGYGGYMQGVSKVNPQITSEQKSMQDLAVMEQSVIEKVLSNLPPDVINPQKLAEDVSRKFTADIHRINASIEPNKTKKEMINEAKINAQNIIAENNQKIQKLAMPLLAPINEIKKKISIDMLKKLPIKLAPAIAGSYLGTFLTSQLGPIVQTMSQIIGMHLGSKAGDFIAEKVFKKQDYTKMIEEIKKQYETTQAT